MAIPASRHVDFSEIPQLDVAALLAGEDDRDLIAALHAACTGAGFFYVRNHGVDPTRITAIAKFDPDVTNMLFCGSCMNCMTLIMH